MASSDSSVMLPEGIMAVTNYFLTSKSISAHVQHRLIITSFNPTLGNIRVIGLLLEFLFISHRSSQTDRAGLRHRPTRP